jgi:hypothetical protein
MLKDKWEKMPLVEQMGNIGSEVCRMLRFREARDKEREKMSAELVLELIDLTINDPCQRFRLKEILRLREIIADFFAEARIFNISPESLNDYFLPFATKARGTI